MTTSTNSRLDRLMPGLTFDERLDAIITAYHRDRLPDPAFLKAMPPDDYARWNVAARILNGLHSRLGWYIDLVESFVAQLELRHLLDRQTRLAFALCSPAAPAAEAIAARMRLRVVADLLQRWQEVRLAELAVVRLGDDLGGRSLLHPDSAATLASCRQRLLALHDELATDASTPDNLELPEPPGSDLDALLDLLTLQRSLA
jgi:hypothetical protein